jgi:hypothetical protein
MEAIPAVATAETSEWISHETEPGPISPGSPAGSAKISRWSCRPTWEMKSSAIRRLTRFSSMLDPARTITEISVMVNMGS